jgi:alginate O-acetyltransferase complex protein AlgF
MDFSVFPIFPSRRIRMDRRSINMLNLSFVAALFSFAPTAIAQEIGKLYAARPPEGYAFVRVARLGAGDVDIDNRKIEFKGSDTVSRYGAIKPDKGVKISIDGSIVGEKVVFPPNQFSTIVLVRAKSGWSSYVVEEGRSVVNDLKAQLRFFNLVSECQASLRVVDGPTIFDATAIKDVRSRAINPVQATVEALCENNVASLVLPTLRAGDHFSLFLIHREGKLDLSGQFDETEPYQGR